MKDHTGFRRKVIYMAAMAALLVPLSFISQPATTTGRGGWLAQMRAEHRLSQAQLGEIDPAGASMNLATLGMRGVAANILWTKALYYKKTEDWSNLKASLNQIIKLQPNFISVWRFQSWELAYNVAAEFDDYRNRYHWVKKGVDFLLEGVRYNRDEPMLIYDIGWFFAHKLGRSDDRRQFRRLYRHDDDFHKTLPIDIDLTRGPDNYPDNWLTAWVWYTQAQQLVDTKNAPLRGKNPLLFHSNPAMALIYYAIAVEEDGYLDEKGKEAWARAERAWTQFGNRTIRASGGQYEIRLNERDEYFRKAAEDGKEIDRLAPGVREQLTAERRAKLTQAERDALDKPIAERSLEEMQTASEAAGRVVVRYTEVAARAPEEHRVEAMRIARRATLRQGLATWIDDSRTQVNFDYWLTRCQVEQQDNTILARRYLEEAERLYDEAKLEQARETYELAWDAWGEVYNNYPILMDDPTAEDVKDSLDRYRDLLGKLEESFPPPNFKLNAFLEYQDPTYRAPVTPTEGDATEPQQSQDPPAADPDDSARDRDEA